MKSTNIFHSFCEPSVLCCAVVIVFLQEVFPKAEAVSHRVLCYATWVLSQDAGLMPMSDSLPSPRFVALPNQKKKGVRPLA